jgi:hypothetical protein
MSRRQWLDGFGGQFDHLRVEIPELSLRAATMFQQQGINDAARHAVELDNHLNELTAS